VRVRMQLMQAMGLRMVSGGGRMHENARAVAPETVAPHERSTAAALPAASKCAATSISAIKTVSLHRMA